MFTQKPGKTYYLGSQVVKGDGENLFQNHGWYSPAGNIA